MKEIMSSIVFLTFNFTSFHENYQSFPHNTATNLWFKEKFQETKSSSGSKYLAVAFSSNFDKH